VKVSKHEEYLKTKKVSISFLQVCKNQGDSKSVLNFHSLLIVQI